MDISIIIVSWNARDYLINCLNSITETVGNLSYEVFVVDNASHDGSPEAVRAAALPHVKLIETGANLGFAKANNIAIRQSHGKYCCLINSDVIVKPDCLQRLFTFMESHGEIGLAGPRLLNRDGTYQSSCRRQPTLATHFARAIFINTSVADPAYKGDNPSEVGVLAGSFWIARRESFEEVGLLDEAFFFYGEDHDWCERYWAAGWKVCFYPGAQAIHFGGASSAADPFRFNTELQKAVLQHWEKYHGRISTLAYLLIGVLYHGLRLGCRSLRLVLPVGDRTATLTKWKQHWASLRWLRGAVTARLSVSRRSVRGITTNQKQTAP